MNFNQINIHWQSDKLIASNSFDDLAIELDLPSYFNVLYQIYGFSPIYGDNALLYIGITKDSLRRINQHLNIIFGRGLDLKIRIGKIDGITDSSEILEIAESILIALHKPSYNSEYIHNVYYKSIEDYYMILNHGNRGALMLECSNIWWKEEIEKRLQRNDDSLSYVPTGLIT